MSPCAEVELDAGVVARPLEPVQPALRPQRAGRSVAGPRRARRGSRASSCAGRRARPPGRSSRAASGIQRYGSHQIDAPYSERARSNDSSGQRHVLGVRLDSGNSSPNSSLHPPRRLELRRRDVDADDARAAPREPRRRSTPCRSRARPRPCRRRRRARPSSRSGTRTLPQVISVLRPRARGPARSVYSAFALRPDRAVDRDVVGLRRAHRGTRARSRARPTRASRSRGRGCPASRARGRRGSCRARRRPGSSRPSSCATIAIAPSPSSTSASVGAEVMKSTSSPKNGFSACSA